MLFSEPRTDRMPARYNFRLQLRQELQERKPPWLTSMQKAPLPALRAALFRRQNCTYLTSLLSRSDWVKSGIVFPRWCTNCSKRRYAGRKGRPIISLFWGELSYIVTFSNLTIAQTTITCAAIAREVCENLFGDHPCKLNLVQRVQAEAKCDESGEPRYCTQASFTPTVSNIVPP